jgi:hypothetical protein
MAQQQADELDDLLMRPGPRAAREGGLEYDDLMMRGAYRAENDNLLEESLAAGRPWAEIEADYRRRVPGGNPHAARIAYEAARHRRAINERLAEQQRAHEHWEEPTLRWLNRRIFPIVSSVGRFFEGRSYQNAAERIRAGNPQDDDFRAVAQYERQAHNEENASFGGKALSAAAQLPATFVEFATGGRILGAGARALTAGARAGGAASGAAASAQAIAQAARPASYLARAGQSAAVTPLVPSLYLDAANQNMLQGQGAPEAFGRALTYGAAQAAVVGNVLRPGSGGVGGWLSRVGTAMGEQQVVDLGSHLLRVQETGGGILGLALRGQAHEAGEHAALQAMTFAAFGLLHRRNRAQEVADALRRRGASPEQVRQALHEMTGTPAPAEPAAALDALQAGGQALQARGLSAEAAAARLGRVLNPLAEAVARDPDLTRAEGAAVLGDFLRRSADPELRKYAIELLRQRPVRRPGPPEPPEPPAAAAPEPTPTPPPPAPPAAAGVAAPAAPPPPRPAAPPGRVEQGPRGVDPAAAELGFKREAVEVPARPTLEEVRRQVIASFEAIGVEVRPDAARAKSAVQYEKATGNVVFHLAEKSLQRWASYGPEALEAFLYEEFHHARHEGNKNAKENAANWQRLPDEVKYAVNGLRGTVQSDGGRFLEYARMRQQLDDLGHVTEWYVPSRRAAAERAEAAIRAHEQAGGTALPGRPVEAAPYAAAPEADVRALAKSLGLSDKGSRAAVVGRLVKAKAEPALAELERLATQPRPEPAPPAAPEPAPARPEAPDGPVERARQNAGVDESVHRLRPSSEAEYKQIHDYASYLAMEGRYAEGAERAAVEAELRRLGARVEEVPVPGGAPEPLLHLEKGGRRWLLDHEPWRWETELARPEAPRPEPARVEAMPAAERVTAPDPLARRPGESRRAWERRLDAEAERLSGVRLESGEKAERARMGHGEVERDPRREAEIQASDLPGRSKDVLLRRFAGESQEQIGRRYGLSRERIRQVEAQALEKMGYPERSVEQVMANERLRAVETRTAGPDPAFERFVPGGEMRGGRRGAPGSAERAAKKDDLYREPGRAGDPEGPPAAAPGAPTGPYEIANTVKELLDATVYYAARTPGNAVADAAALMRENAAVVRRAAAGDPKAVLEEAVHLAARRLGVESDPRLQDPEVRKSLAALDPYGKGNVEEGFAAWAERRVTGRGAYTEAQKAGAAAAEAFARDKGLLPALDRVRELFGRYEAQTPTQKAAGLLSPTAQPAAPELTRKEQAGGILTRLKEWFQDNILNNLAVLKRAGMEKARTRWAQLQFSEEARARQWEHDGVSTLVDGRLTVVGLPLAEITAGARPEWLEPLRPEQSGAWSRLRGAFTKPEQVTALDLYATARHADTEARAGRGFVPDAQLALYREALAELRSDPARAAWLEQAANKLTRGFNSMLDALAAPEVHRLDPELVRELKERYPDYVPTTRVKEDFFWKSSGRGKGREQMAQVLFERTGSGEQIVSPLVSYKDRLRRIAAQWTEQLRRNAIAEALQGEGMGRWGVANREPVIVPDGDPYFQNAPWPKDGSPLWYWYGPKGELTNFKIGDRAFYDLITHQQGDSSSAAQLFRALGNIAPLKWASEAVRKGATALSLGFQARNVFPTRDPATFLANTVNRASAGKLPGVYRDVFRYEWARLRGRETGDPVYDLFARERGREQRQFAFETPGIETARSKAELLKQLINTAGAGELAPRYLEFLNVLEAHGWTRARLDAEVAAARAAAKSGKAYQDPVPFDLLQRAMEAAHQVTTPFGEQGILTREVNKTAVFFGPAVTGMAKYLRNWRENWRGAATALGALMAARVLHWSLFHREEWYQELSANDRYHNFVVPVPGLGLRRLPGPRGLDVAAGGTITAVLDAAARNNPDVAGLVEQSLKAALPPLPAPTPAVVGSELMLNRNWQGSPIVPRRAEALPQSEQWSDFRLPYAAQQLLGGGGTPGEVLRRGPAGLVPFSEVRRLPRSVDEFYAALHALEAQQASYRRRGLAFPDEDRLRELRQQERRLLDLSRAARGARAEGRRVVEGERPDEETVRAIRLRQTDVARSALR